jgi:hypothetical protein
MPGINKNKKPIIVYWSPEAVLEREHQQILLDIKPKSLMLDIQKRRAINPNNPKNAQSYQFGTGYHQCSALHELIDNTYVVKSPFDASITLDETGSVIQSGERFGWFADRSGSIQNAFCVDFDLSYYFFCEEQLEVSITPPYMHQTNQPEYGFISSVKWDISSWFRGFILIYQLWEGKNKVYFYENEPLAYLHFHTDRRIIFKEFSLNEEILNIANACGKHKFIMNFEPMAKLYKRFNQTSIKKRLTKAIKDNII